MVDARVQNAIAFANRWPLKILSSLASAGVLVALATVFPGCPSEPDSNPGNTTSGPANTAPSSSISTAGGEGIGGGGADSTALAGSGGDMASAGGMANSSAATTTGSASSNSSGGGPSGGADERIWGVTIDD